MAFSFFAKVRRDSDSMTEQIAMSFDVLNKTHGYGGWMHCVVTYKYEDSGNNLELFLDGRVCMMVYIDDIVLFALSSFMNMVEK